MNQLEWIYSNEALSLIKRASEMFAGGSTTLQVVKSLRKSISPGQASQLIEQIELRQRAQTKFSLAEKMFFTRQQLEQSTSEIVAHYKARRFLQFQRVVDLCCGIGGDSIALAQISDLQIVDTNQQVLQMAEQNVKAYGRSSHAILSDAESIDVSMFDAFHLDPDRRPESSNANKNRTTSVERFTPGLEQIKAFEKSNGNFGIKLAPATLPWDGEYELEFIGHLRECKQQVVWSGELMDQEGTTATVLDNSGNRIDSFSRRPDQRVAPHNIPTSSVIPKYVYDPHSCLLASGLLADFANEYELTFLCQKSRYLVSDRKIDSLLTPVFEIVDIIKPEIRTIEHYLKSHDIGVLGVKKRGSHDELYGRLQKLKLKGKKSITILLSNTPLGIRAIACHRLDNQSNA